MHLHADDVDVAHFRGAFINRSDAIQPDAELVFAFTGGDVLVCRNIDIGIDAQRNRRARIFGSGDLVDVGELRFALGVYAANALLQRVLDLLARFADAGKGTFR